MVAGLGQGHNMFLVDFDDRAGINTMRDQKLLCRRNVLDIDGSAMLASNLHNLLMRHNTAACLLRDREVNLTPFLHP